MNEFLDFMLDLLIKFGGGSGNVEDNIVRFALAAMFWGVLLVVAWSRQRQQELPREKLLVWGFGLGLGRELFMFGVVSVQMLGLIEGETVSLIFPPLELALGAAAVVVVAGSFLHYILDDERLSRRYLRLGLGVTGVAYLATFWWWIAYHTGNPGAKYPQTWGAWWFRLGASLLAVVPIILLARKRGWLRNVVSVALTFFFLSEFLMLFNPVAGDRARCVLCPLSHNFHIWAIPLLGYVYIREQSIERVQAESEVRRRNEELIALNAIATIISQSLDLQRMLTAILDKVLAVMKADAGWIYLFDQDSDVPSQVAERELTQQGIQGTCAVEPDQGLIRQVIQTGQPGVINGFDLPGATDVGRPEERGAFVNVPIQLRDEMLGVLSVFARNAQKPSSQQVQLLTAIGHQIGVAVENARLVQEASRVEILQELNRLRSELIANVSHELRTPLGLIKYSCTSLLAEDVEFDREVQREFLRGIDDETDRLNRIVENLLDLSQIESGRLHLVKSPTDVGRLARDTITPVEVQATDHRFAYRFSPEPLVAVLDSKRIEQVLRNLLGNAIKYSPGGGVITVQGGEDGGQLVVQVSDQGIGIPRQDLDQVFERFYRVENEITQTVGGVGLGLAVCRSIVEAHGGRIWVESTLGQGSTFFFTLPLGSGSKEYTDGPLDDIVAPA